jgi:hypothetical protein
VQFCAIGDAIPSFADVCSAAANDVGPTTLTGSVSPGVQFALDVFARGEGRGNSSLQAAADPIFSIASELIPGTNISYVDAFAVVLSPHVVQQLTPATAPVSEPRTLWVLTMGLVSMIAIRCKP